jgi:cytoskeletal protein CcmA (bactofilin family)
VDQAIIGKGLIVKGEIAGTESLFIDGRVEGSVNLPGERVTVGQNGRVVASMTASMNVCITAREIVVMGNVSGNVSADRVEIRAGGKLNGDISTARISIADGAFFKGGIDIRESSAKPAAGTAAGPLAKA